MQHSDPFDAASESEDAFRAQALANMRESMKESHPDFDGETCLDCAEEMPKERLAWGRIRCTACADVLERAVNGRFYRRG
jgi:uncharacterized cysteine cluster protein YcgN (CxxCxxCC family)